MLVTRTKGNCQSGKHYWHDLQTQVEEGLRLGGARNHQNHKVEGSSNQLNWRREQS